MPGLAPKNVDNMEDGMIESETKTFPFGRSFMRLPMLKSHIVPLLLLHLSGLMTKDAGLI